jgi:hypothetical protein
MKKFYSYLKKNIKVITCILLLSISYVFLVFPQILNVNIFKQFFLFTPRNQLIGITAFIFFLLVISWDKLQNYWEKVRNTYNLENPPFLLIHGIIIFIFISFLLKIIFQKEFFLFLNLSKDFIIFLFLNATLLIIWFIFSYYLKNKKVKKECVLYFL